MATPNFLAGPIVRRASTEEVCIWFALDNDVDAWVGIKRGSSWNGLTTENNIFQPTEINLIDKENSESNNKYTFSVCGKAEKVQLGKAFFVYLARVISIKKVKLSVTDILLDYSITFQKSSNESLNFEILKSQFTFGNRDYPTFIIQGNDELKAYFGSCRKIHDKGLDSLAKIGKEFSKRLSDKNKNSLAITESLAFAKSFFNNETLDALNEARNIPNVLLLGGDQIYADDVALPILDIIKSLKTTSFEIEEKPKDEIKPNRQEIVKQISKRGYLPGVVENLADIEYAETLKRLNSKESKWEDAIRESSNLKQNLAFTSDEATNHLITFSEYCIMYCLMWNDEFWKKNIDLTKIDFKDKDEKETIENFIKSLPLVRKLLANIPTYMIFDDHDVTDDWNFTTEWKDNVRNKPFGRRVVANALAAYWVFQGWGNNPNDFNDNIIKNAIENRKNDYTTFENTMLDFHNWEFATPTNPFIYFLDTRTEREGDESPVILKSSDVAWKKTKEKLIGLIEKYPQNFLDKHPLIFISASPIWGVYRIELLAKLDKVFEGSEKPDFEGWTANKQNDISFYSMLKDIYGKKKINCIALSGDVHYAYSVNLDLILNKNIIGNILSLTSSALKNSAGSWIMNIVNKILSYNDREPVIPINLKGKVLPIQFKANKEKKIFLNGISHNIKATFFQNSSILNSKVLTKHNFGFLRIRNMQGNFRIQDENELNTNGEFKF